MFWLLLLIFLAVAAILLYLHITRNFNYWKNKKVPYLKPIPFFGNVFKVFMLNKSVGKFLQDLHVSTNSPYYGFFVFDQPFLLLRDPEVIKLFLIKDFENFNDRSVIENERDDPIGANILFIIKNPAWKTLRTKISPAFSTAKMRNMVPLMVEVSDDLVDYMNKQLHHKSIDIREVSMKFTTDIIASCAFGLKAHCFKDENAAFRVASRRVWDWNFNRASQVASYFFAPMLVKLFKFKFVDPLAREFLVEAFWKTLIEREKTKAYRGDLIDILIQIKKQNSDGAADNLDDLKLVSQAIVFFIAGFESTGSVVSFTLYELSVNPTLQNRLRKEIKSVLKKHGGITYQAIQEMDYLSMVINETLRKYPVLPFLDRRCTKTYQIPGTDVVIEKGLPIYISLFGLHSDPEYFPDPERYDPERFAYKIEDNKPNFFYMPFGEGPHNCIGARFGLLTAKVGLIRILSEFEAELSADSPVPMVLDKKGVLVSPETGKLPLHFKYVI